MSNQVDMFDKRKSEEQSALQAEDGDNWHYAEAEDTNRIDEAGRDRRSLVHEDQRYRT